MAVRQSVIITEQWQKIILTLLVLLFLWLVRDILVLLILALTVATAVNPLVNWLGERRWPRTLAVAFVYIIVLLIIVAFLFFLIPSLLAQLRGLIQVLPAFYERFLSAFESLENVLERSRVGSPEQLVGELSGLITRVASGLLLSTLTFLRAIASLVIILVISFYLVIREKGIEDFLRAVTPQHHEEYILDLWARVSRKIGRWLQGQLLLGLIIGVMTYVGLLIFKMPFALTLAVIAGILELVPFIGPVIAAIPAVILGFSQSTSLGVMMIVLYIIIQQLENHLITPTVTRKLVGLNPVIVIVALIGGGTLAGLVGVLIAIPVTVTLVEIFNDFASRKRTQRQHQIV